MGVVWLKDNVRVDSSKERRDRSCLTWGLRLALVDVWGESVRSAVKDNDDSKAGQDGLIYRSVTKKGTLRLCTARALSYVSGTGDLGLSHWLGGVSMWS